MRFRADPFFEIDVILHLPPDQAMDSKTEPELFYRRREGRDFDAQVDYAIENQ
ncbi:MAG: hypothetical protein GF398_21900 [Chitinivibrionales bacterium]|nr:hypothetical protein [Chitinivibrionales bacterium]